MAKNNELIRLAKKAADAWRNTDAYYQAAQIIDMLVEELESNTLTQPNEGAKDKNVPTNEPLTLEQLREMKDKPAYLKVFDPLLESGWHIIKVVTEDKIIFRGWQTVYVPIDGMGIDYNLYRRPPEGEEDT